MAMFNWVRRKDRKSVELPDLSDVATQAPGGNARQLPRFLSSGRDIGPLGGAESSARGRVRDAFTPSQPVQDPRMFAGRTEILRTLIRSIEDLCLHVVVYGDRGIGKTSLLHLLTRLATDADYHVAYHSCGERDTFSETFRGIASQIPLLYDSRFNPTAAETESGGSLAKMLPEGDFPVSQLSDAFSHLSNTRLIVVFDEYDRSPEGDFRRSIAEFIKNVSDRSLRIQLVIAGVGANLAEMVEHIPSIRRNILGLHVPAMSAAEVREVIAIGEGISGLRFAPDAIDRIVYLANGSPYLASMLAQYAGFRTVEKELNRVTAKEIAAAAAQISGELRGRLPERIGESVDAAVAGEQGPVLMALAQAAMGSMGRIELDKGDGAISSADFAAAYEGLRRYPDLIEPVPNEPDGRYRFVEEGLPLYLWILLAGR